MYVANIFYIQHFTHLQTMRDLTTHTWNPTISKL